MIAGVHHGQISQRCASIASPLSSIAGGKKTTEEEYSVPLLYDQWVRIYKNAPPIMVRTLVDSLTPITNFSRDPVLCRPV
jgi:hypothetical protein